MHLRGLFVTLADVQQPNQAPPIKLGSIGTPIETPPVPSSSVHPPETSVLPHPGLTLQPPPRVYCEGFDSRPATTLEQSHRHSGWAWRRWKVWQAMERACVSAKRRDHFATCGAQLTLCKRGDELCLSCFCCHDRFCEVCQEARRRHVASNIEHRCIEAGDNVRFFTFTLRHSDTPLADQVKRLRHCLRLLHRRPWWQQHAKGGYDCIECKPAKNGHGWHVHAHCLVEGEWTDQRELSRVWHAITGDSTIVDVERKGTIEAMARYATKYATKPLHHEVYTSAVLLDEALIALKGMRLTQAWGTWHDVEKDEDQPTQPLEEIGSIARLIDASLDGDPGARLWLQLACCRWPSLESQVPTAAIAALPPPDPHPPDEAPPPSLDERHAGITEPLPF